VPILENHTNYYKVTIYGQVVNIVQKNQLYKLNSYTLIYLEHNSLLIQPTTPGKNNGLVRTTYICIGCYTCKTHISNTVTLTETWTHL